MSDADGIEFLEHVQVKVYITSKNRGDVIIDLVCPSGTPSQLLDSRRDSKASAIDWTLMTVRCWGESPLGEYTLKVKSSSASSQNIVHSRQMILLGTSKQSGVDSVKVAAPCKVSPVCKKVRGGRLLTP